jgi:hypothetical protein
MNSEEVRIWKEVVVDHLKVLSRVRIDDSPRDSNTVQLHSTTTARYIQFMSILGVFNDNVLIA